MLDRAVRAASSACATPRGLLDDTPADPLADEDYPLSPLDSGALVLYHVCYNKNSKGAINAF